MGALSFNASLAYIALIGSMDESTVIDPADGAYDGACAASAWILR
jgi:hypothetical protein